MNARTRGVWRRSSKVSSQTCRVNSSSTRPTRTRSEWASPTSMGYGDAAQVRWGQAERPSPGAGQVLVDARYDLVLDIAGSRPVRACRALLTPQGRYLASVGRLGFLLRVLLAKLVWRRIGSFHEQVNPADLGTLAAWLAEGRIRAVVERQYPLDKAPAALAAFIAGPNGAKTLLTR